MCQCSLCQVKEESSGHPDRHKTALLYVADTWAIYSRHLKALEQYHKRSLCKILTISWTDGRTNISDLREANIRSIVADTTRLQLRRTGHVVRIPNNTVYGQYTNNPGRSAKGRKMDPRTAEEAIQRQHQNPPKKVSQRLGGDC